MKTDFSRALRTSQTTATPLRQTERAGAVARTGASGIDTALADRGSKTLEDVLTRYGSGVSPIESKDPFERLSNLSRQVSDLFDKDPSVIDQIRGDKQLSTSIQRLARRMLDRLPHVSPEIRDSYMRFAQLAGRIDPLEPKPILP